MARNPRGNDLTRFIRSLFWLYFWLLIIEGALRKWVMPGLSNPLLVVRDPVALLIYIMALFQGRLPRHWLFSGLLFLTGVFCFLGMIQILFLNLPPVVVIYGIRADFLHLPLIFIAAKALRRRDVILFGKWVLIITIPMTLLMALQYLAPSSDILNTTAGGEGEQMGAALGRIRPAGTFSFSTGPASFYPLAAAFVIYGFVRKGTFNRILLWTALGCLILTQPISGSRLLVLNCSVVLVMAALASVYSARTVFRFLAALMVGLLLVWAISSTSIFQEGVQSFSARWEVSTKEGVRKSIVMRWVGAITVPLSQIWEYPPLGYGLGVGTNVGARLLVGHRAFLLAEGEWSRVLAESGFFFGILYLGYRCLLAFRIGSLAFRNAKSNLDPLSWLLFSTAVLLLVSGQFSQTNILGFAAFNSTLCLAALSTPGARRRERIGDSKLKMENREN